MPEQTHAAIISNTGQRIFQNTQMPPFYQFPRFLLTIPISQTARIVYMILYDRLRLSKRNGWVDEIGGIYIHYPLKNLSKNSGRSISAVKLALNELIEHGLLEKEPRGFGKPNRLYPLIPSDFEPSERSISDFKGGRKQAPNKISNNNNKMNHNSVFNFSHGFVNYDYDEEE